MNFISLLAAINPLPDNPIPDTGPSTLFGLGARDIFLVLGVAIALGLLIFIWAYLTHKGRSHRHSGQHLSKPLEPVEKLSPEAAALRVKMRRRRRRHPENLPRNPTLGETGGLPPIRPEEPPAASPEGAPQS